MKRNKTGLILTAIVLLSWPNTAWADSRSPSGTGSAVTGGYGGPSAKLTTDTNGPAVYVGGRGEIVLWDRLAVGGGGYIGIPEGDSEGGTAGYGGLVIEVLGPSVGAIGISWDLLLGAGGGDYDAPTYGDSESFLVAEAGVCLNVRVTDFLTVSPTVRYLQTVPLASETERSNDLTGPSAGLQLRFGQF